MDKPKMTATEAAKQLRQPQGNDGVTMGVQMNKSNKLIYDMTLANLGLQPGDRVLEIGMGNGHFIPALFELQSSIRYTGLDYSAVMVQEAIAANRGMVEAGKVSIQEGTADKMSFDTGYFNKVFAVNVLYFWDPPVVSLEEICRVLQPGGEVLLAFRSKRTMAQLPFVDHGFTLYDEDMVREILEKTGFQVSDIQVAVEPPKFAADGSMLVQLENIIMKGVKNFNADLTFS